MPGTDKRDQIVGLFRSRIKAELEKGGDKYSDFDGVSKLRKEILPTIAVVELEEKSDKHGRRAYLRTLRLQVEVAFIEKDPEKSFESGRAILTKIRDGVESDDNLGGIAADFEEAVNSIETAYDPMVVVAVQWLIRYVEKFPVNG